MNDGNQIQCHTCKRTGNLICRSCRVSNWQLDETYKTNCVQCLQNMKYYTCESCRRFYFYICEGCKLYYCADCIKQNTIDFNGMSI